MMMANNYSKDTETMKKFNKISSEDVNCIDDDCNLDVHKAQMEIMNIGEINVSVYMDHNTIPPDLSVPNPLFRFFVDSFSNKHNGCFTRFFRFKTIALGKARSDIKKYMQSIAGSNHLEAIEFRTTHHTISHFHVTKSYGMNRIYVHKTKIIDEDYGSSAFGSMNVDKNIEHMVSSLSFVPYLQNCGWFAGYEIPNSDKCEKKDSKSQ